MVRLCKVVDQFEIYGCRHCQSFDQEELSEMQVQVPSASYLKDRL